MDIVLACAGVFVTMLVIVGMVLIAPLGAEPVVESTSNLSLAPDEQAELPTPDSTVTAAAPASAAMTVDGPGSVPLTGTP